MAGTSTTAATFPMSLDKPMTVVVERPAKKLREKDEEEVLVIEGIEVKSDEFVKFDVFINDEDEVVAGGGAGAEKIERAGSFVSVPHKHRDSGGDYGGKMKKTQLRIGISELLEVMGVGDDEDVVVKLVPRCDNVHVTISGVKIEIE